MIYRYVNTCVIYWGKVHSRSIPHAWTTQKFINVAKLRALQQSRLRSHCSTTKMFAINTERGAHLWRLCLQICCMLALLLKSLSGCPLSSRCQLEGCLWLRSTFYCLRSSHPWRISHAPFLPICRFLQARGGHKSKKSGMSLLNGKCRWMQAATLLFFLGGDWWVFFVALVEHNSNLLHQVWALWSLLRLI